MEENLQVKTLFLVFTFFHRISTFSQIKKADYATAITLYIFTTISSHYLSHTSHCSYHTFTLLLSHLHITTVTLHIYTTISSQSYCPTMHYITIVTFSYCYNHISSLLLLHLRIIRVTSSYY